MFNYSFPSLELSSYWFPLIPITHIPLHEFEYSLFCLRLFSLLYSTMRMYNPSFTVSPIKTLDASYALESLDNHIYICHVGETSP